MDGGADMKIKVLLVSLLFACSLLCGISLAQDKVVVIPLGTDATGDAAQSHVLKGKTFSNQNATGLTGTRPPAPVPKMTSGSSGKGVPWPNPRFSGGIIPGYTDQLTGLRWSTPDNVARKWVTAVNHCYAYSTGIPPLIFNDWRMPTLRELHSLIDYSVENPAIQTGHPFGTIINGPYWSSTLEVYDTTFPENAWTVNISTGKVEIKPVTGVYFVWCVRGGINE